MFIRGPLARHGMWRMPNPMGTHREHDPLVEFLQDKHEHVLESIRRVLAGAAPVHGLVDIRKVIDALGVAETAVLQPAFERVTLREDSRQLLADYQDNRALQRAALDGLLRSRSARIRKLRAAELIDLVQQHTERYVELLIPVLRSQLPRAFYRALANAFDAGFEGRLPGLEGTGDRDAATVRTDDRLHA